MMKKKSGFTLIELVMAMVIMAIIAGASVPLIIAMNEGWIISTQRNEMAETARLAMDRMIREARRIKDKTSVIVANSSRIQFVNISNENITFDLSGSSLQRTINGAASSLADNVSSISFTYYNSVGATIAAPIVNPTQTDIRRIEINLNLSLGNTQLRIRGQVSPRRLK